MKKQKYNEKFVKKNSKEIDCSIKYCHDTFPFGSEFHDYVREYIINNNLCPELVDCEDDFSEFLLDRFHKFWMDILDDYESSYEYEYERRKEHIRTTFIS